MDTNRAHVKFNFLNKKSYEYIDHMWLSGQFLLQFGLDLDSNNLQCRKSRFEKENDEFNFIHFEFEVTAGH